MPTTLTAPPIVMNLVDVDGDSVTFVQGEMPYAMRHRFTLPTDALTEFAAHVGHTYRVTLAFELVEGD